MRKGNKSFEYQITDCAKSNARITSVYTPLLHTHADKGHHKRAECKMWQSKQKWSKETRLVSTVVQEAWFNAHYAL